MNFSSVRTAFLGHSVNHILNRTLKNSDSHSGNFFFLESLVIEKPIKTARKGVKREKTSLSIDSVIHFFFNCHTLFPRPTQHKNEQIIIWKKGSCKVENRNILKLEGYIKINRFDRGPPSNIEKEKKKDGKRQNCQPKEKRNSWRVKRVHRENYWRKKSKRALEMIETQRGKEPHVGKKKDLIIGCGLGQQYIC